MSFTRPPDRLQSPAELFVEFKDGGFTIYDKELKKRIPYELKEFVVLDCSTFAITGYSQELKSGCFSNAARSATKDKLVVKAREKGIIAQGFYNDIKPELKRLKFNYTRKVYLMNRGQIVCLDLKGDAFSSWMEAIEMKDRGERKRNSQYVVIAGMEERKNGSVIYQHLFFDFGGPISPKHMQDARDADQIVQGYLDDYFKVGADKQTEASDKDAGSTESSESKWYEFTDPHSDKLITFLTAKELIELSVNLGDNGEAGTPLGGAVEEMMKRIEWGATAWKTFATAKGKIIGDTSPQEAEGMLKWCMENQPGSNLRFAVEAAVLHHKSKEVPPASMGEVDEDDTIPF